MCGIIGIQGMDPVTELLFLGMTLLQHRGQDAAGVFLSDPSFLEPILKKRSGLVFDLFRQQPFLDSARWGLGHIRYSTSGKGGLEDAQPLVTVREGRSLAIVHNGNLVNYLLLKNELEKDGAFFKTNCDSEAILHLLDRALASHSSLPFFDALCLAVSTVFKRVSGAYSIIGMATDQGIFAFRDPKGIRPLLLGKGENLLGLASETAALVNIGCKEIQDVVPGEVIFFDGQGKLHRKTLAQKKHSHCAFEFNYFAKSATVMEGKEIYSIRNELGRLLAKKIKALPFPPIDVVVPIPDTGNPAGIALSHHLQVPFAEGFIRNSSSGRTFIMASSEKRQSAAHQKLIPIRSVFHDKTVLLVDDSIIRGTVSKRTVALARNAGAKKILFASTFPPVIYPCVYGIDFPSRDQLIAATKSIAQITIEIGADAVIYNEVEDLKEGIGLDDLCLACVTGRYPTPRAGMKSLQLLRAGDLLALEKV